MNNSAENWSGSSTEEESDEKEDLDSFHQYLIQSEGGEENLQKIFIFSTILPPLPDWESEVAELFLVHVPQVWGTVHHSTNAQSARSRKKESSLNNTPGAPGEKPGIFCSSLVSYI